jgi:hypothetical protein
MIEASPGVCSSPSFFATLNAASQEAGTTFVSGTFDGYGLASLADTVGSEIRSVRIRVAGLPVDDALAQVGRHLRRMLRRGVRIEVVPA